MGAIKAKGVVGGENKCRGGEREGLRGAYMLLAVALQEQEVGGLVEGVPHAAPAPLLRRGPPRAGRTPQAVGQGGAVPAELLLVPRRRAAQAALAEAASQGRGGAEPLSPRQHPHGPPGPVPLQFPRLGVDACGRRSPNAVPAAARVPQHGAGGMRWSCWEPWGAQLESDPPTAPPKGWRPPAHPVSNPNCRAPVWGVLCPPLPSPSPKRGTPSPSQNPR